ncbi:MAG: GIY-YIG nuclease family protein [Desulfobacteraceae bacterium]
MEGFTYVYVLLSEKDATRRYIGLIDDLGARLKSHNQGNNSYTSKYRPWQIETAIAFRSREKAAAFSSCSSHHLGLHLFNGSSQFTIRCNPGIHPLDDAAHRAVPVHVELFSDLIQCIPPQGPHQIDGCSTDTDPTGLPSWPQGGFCGYTVPVPGDRCPLPPEWICTGPGTRPRRCGGFD